ncbi:MAG TPA: hypothetical protein VHZ73_09480 [Vicinamibacterales bacterium]|nr:hypothetical protein [Vicinamibacterales bacterium]
MSKHEVMWTTAGAASVASAFVAALTIWLFLTNPAAVTPAAGRSDTLGMVHAVASAMFHIVGQVLRYL